MSINQEKLKRKAQKVVDNSGNLPLAQLDATIELTDKMEEVINAIKSIPKVEMPEMPSKLGLEGVEMLTIKGEDGKDSIVPGPQGEPGYTPIKDKDYFDGKDGYTPIKGKDYFDGIDGINPDPTEVALEASTIAIEQLKPLIPTIDTFKKEMPILGTEIRDSLEILRDDERLDKSAVKGIELLIDKPTLDRAIGILDQRTSFLVQKVAGIAQNGTGGGGSSITLQTNGTPNGSQTLLNLIQGIGINIADNGAGGITISSSGGGTVTSFAFTDGNGFTGLVTNSTTTPTLALTLQDANTSQSGQLTSTDWNTFNNKVSSQWTTTGSNIYYSTGNVGIGTDATSPTELLFVSKTQDASTNAHFKNLSTGVNAQTQLGVYSDTGGAFFQVLGSNYSYQNSFYGGSSALQSTNRLVFTTDSGVANGGTHSIDFMTGGYDSTTQRRMTIDSTGNVGIGTNITISAKLHTIATTEQFRLGYDTSNYLSHTVGSTGTTTFNTASTATNIFDWQYNGVTKYTLDKTGVTTATDVSSGGTIYTVVGRQRDTSQNDYYLYSYVVGIDSRIALALGRFNGQGYIKLGSGPYDNATLGANYNIWNGSFGNEGLEVNTQGATQPYVGRWAVLGVGRYNSSYDTVEAGLRVDRNSDGTPTAGFGSAVLFQNQSTTTVRRDAGQISSVWSDATDASRTAEMVFSTVYNGGSLAEGFRLLGNGVSKLSFDGSNYFTTSISNTGDTTFTVTGTNADFTFSQAVNFNSDVIFGTIARLKGYTVATLPIAPVLGDMVYVTDALAPAFGVAVAGGGAANAKLWYNGANWTVTGV